MKEPWRVGLWGCGGMGNDLAEALLATDEARLVTAYDVLPDRAASIASKYGAQVAEHAEALLSYPQLDGVIIALPSYLHAVAAVQAAEAGVHIFLEKPMALSVADCHKIIAAARAHNVKLMVGHVLRYVEPYRTILRYQAEGRLGRIFAASIWRLRGSGFSSGAEWRSSISKSGGYIAEVGAHELDMLRCLMGQPQTVCALSQKVLPRPHEWEDHIALQIRFAQGGTGLYEGGFGSFARHYGFRLFFDRSTLTSDAALDPKALRAYDANGQPFSLEADFSPEDPVQAELRGWLAAMREETPVLIPGEEGMATVAVIEAARRSLREGQVALYEIGA